ncbi:hypothetical protein AVP41_00046 [Microbacterium sp. TNHR37B]|nr:hypothetical protein AVP41_00046 [Microbacterium sp. TNHR37B]
MIEGLPVWNLAGATMRDPQQALSNFVIAPHKTVQWSKLTGGTVVAVCSHDCDVENPRTRTGLIVAPLVNVPAPPRDPEMYAKIMASGDTTAGIDFVHLFPVRLPGDDGQERDAVVDFSAITTMARAAKAVGHLADGKRLEMTDATRTAFQRKLALFFGRPYQDPRD